VANNNNPFGFRAISRDSGGPLVTRQYGKASNDGTAIFMNDMVLKAATSVADPTGLGNPAPGCTSAQNATPGTSLYLGASVNYGAASTATMQYVYDSLDTIYIAQSVGTVTIATASHAGKNANLKSGTGNATTKQSTMGIDDTTIATTAGLDFRIIRVSNISPNVDGEYAILEVVLLKSEEGQGTAGV
jgi:hypothetical protein